MKSSARPTRVKSLRWAQPTPLSLAQNLKLNLQRCRHCGVLLDLSLVGPVPWFHPLYVLVIKGVLALVGVAICIHVQCLLRVSRQDIFVTGHGGFHWLLRQVGGRLVEHFHVGGQMQLGYWVNYGLSAAHCFLKDPVPGWDYLDGGGVLRWGYILRVEDVVRGTDCTIHQVVLTWCNYWQSLSYSNDKRWGDWGEQRRGVGTYASRSYL